MDIENFKVSVFKDGASLYFHIQSGEVVQATTKRFPVELELVWEAMRWKYKVYEVCMEELSEPETEEILIITSCLKTECPFIGPKYRRGWYDLLMEVYE